VGRDPAPSGDGRARAGRAGSQPDRRDPRQPEREDDRKRGGRGYDAGKKVNGRKRHVGVDTLGLLLAVAVHPANIQDRDGALLVLAKLKPLYCFLQVLFADSAYTGDNLAAVCLSLSLSLVIVHRLAGIKGFVILPKRWIVERTLAWLSRQRRLSKDYEELIETSQAVVGIAAIRLMLERLENGRRIALNRVYFGIRSFSTSGSSWVFRGSFH
jgi:transposase